MRITLKKFHIIYGSYKLTLKLLRYNPYFPCLLCIAKGNHQELEGGGGRKALLYFEKYALNAATSAISPSKSCPWAAWVVIKVSIIARRERGGGTVGSTATLSACTPSWTVLVVFLMNQHSVQHSSFVHSAIWERWLL